MSEGSRTLRVVVYTSDTKFNIILELNPNDTFGRIKLYVVDELNLKPGSLAIFGLFKVYPGKHHPPVEICNDEDILPRSVDHLTFRRLYFDKEKEMEIIRRDLFALNLIFWEGKYLLQNGSYTGDHEEISKLYEKVDKFAKQKAVSRKTKCVFQLRSREINLVPIYEQASLSKLHHMSACLQPTYAKYMLNIRMGCYKDAVLSLPLLKIKGYVDLMNSSLDLSYWGYYYRILDCVLYGEKASLLAGYLNLNTNFAFDVVLNRTCLSFIGTTASGMTIQLVDFPWLTIRWISKDSKNSTVTFEVPTKNLDGRTIDMLIIFKTKECDFLYSNAKHILDIHTKVKAEAMICSFIPVKEKVELALSIVPEGNSELKVCVMNVLLTPKQEELPFSAAFLTSYSRTPDCVCPNTFSLGPAINLWYVLLHNSQPTLAGSRNNWLGLPTVVSRYSGNEAAKQLEVSPISKDPTRLITVHAFFEGPYHVFLLPGHKTAIQFKEYLTTVLEIYDASLCIFGLFECPPRCQSPLDNTGRLCLDDDPMPDGSHYTFRRLSFKKELESKFAGQTCRLSNSFWLKQFTWWNILLFSL